MNPRDLHHSLDGHAPLAPLRGAPTIFICTSCSTLATIDGLAEAGRRMCMAAFEASDVATVMRGVS